MSTIIRHVITGIIYSLLLAMMVAGVTLFAFPPDKWPLLFERKILDIPFLLFALLIPVIIGAVLGMATGIYWRKRLHSIERRLGKVLNGQPLNDQADPERELVQIQEIIEQVQEKLNKQTEFTQRQATERAREREKSLQEVVIRERNRLARELHDSVSQQLFAASMMMSAINEANPPENKAMKQQLAMIEKAIHQSQLEMRALLLHLRPAALKGKSLTQGIEELLVELMQKVPMEIDWKIETVQAGKGVEDHLFRILQESVSNTLRHAKANTLHVMLIKRDGFIIMRVVDDGVGFDIEKVRASSYGLQNMKERAEELGGTFKMISLSEQGSRMEVKIPLLKGKGEQHD